MVSAVGQILLEKEVAAQVCGKLMDKLAILAQLFIASGTNKSQFFASADEIASR